MPDTGTINVELLLHGLHCAGCVRTVEQALLKVPGVREADVNLATERATVRLSADDPPATEKLVAAVRAAGYGAEPAATSPTASSRQAERDARLADQRRRLRWALLLGCPVIAWHLLTALPWTADWSALHALPPWLVGPIQAALAAAVIVVAGGPMVAGAARALTAGSASMDLLVSLGALAAFASSTVDLSLALHRGPHPQAHVAFDAAVMIVLFVSLGKYLEAKARGRASSAMEALLQRIPPTALRVESGQAHSVPTDAVRPGDILRVPADSMIPVDGEVVSGSATVDESLLTGESVPVERSAGQVVLGGTRVADGLFDMRATADGAHSAAARIARLVQDAQATKPPWQRFADRAAAVFVPVVLVLAAATFAGWSWVAGAEPGWALQRAIAVLVVACPCALGLAIPVAVMVGTARAAGEGILVRDAAALEAAGQIGEVLLDKTGTLTMGRPSLELIELLGTWPDIEVLRLAAALEQLSAHPLARAIVAAAEQRGISAPAATDLRSRPGGGVSGDVDGRRVVVGNAAWLRSSGVATSEAEERADALAAKGHTAVWVAVDGQPAALLALSDPPHPEAAAAVAALRRLGIGLRILSGDRQAAVSHLAGALGIEAFEAGLTPQQKLERVRGLEARGRRVAMVGDGINDAPALASATVGIAIGTGADVAREAADICLVGHSPRLVAEAIRLSRASARVMRQNLFWAVAYNLVMIPLAMLAPVPPSAATAAMMLSSLTVVGNSLRLRARGR